MVIILKSLRGETLKLCCQQDSDRFRRTHFLLNYAAQDANFCTFFNFTYCTRYAHMYIYVYMYIS